MTIIIIEILDSIYLTVGFDPISICDIQIAIA